MGDVVSACDGPYAGMLILLQWMTSLRVLRRLTPLLRHIGLHHECPRQQWMPGLDESVVQEVVGVGLGRDCDAASPCHMWTEWYSEDSLPGWMSYTVLQKYTTQAPAIIMTVVVRFQYAKQYVAWKWDLACKERKWGGTGMCCKKMMIG